MFFWLFLVKMTLAVFTKKLKDLLERRFLSNFIFLHFSLKKCCDQFGERDLIRLPT